MKIYNATTLWAEIGLLRDFAFVKHRIFIMPYRMQSVN